MGVGSPAYLGGLGLVSTVRTPIGKFPRLIRETAIGAFHRSEVFPAIGANLRIERDLVVAIITEEPGSSGSGRGFGIISIKTRGHGISYDLWCFYLIMDMGFFASYLII